VYFLYSPTFDLGAPTISIADGANQPIYYAGLSAVTVGGTYQVNFSTAAWKAPAAGVVEALNGAIPPDLLLPPSYDLQIFTAGGNDGLISALCVTVEPR
jgi:hypothetical protein